MKPIIYIYTDSYHDARRLFASLYHPAKDKSLLCRQKEWENDKLYFEIETDWEVWRIYKKEV